MPTFTLVYADHNDPATTHTFTLSAPDDRWAMGTASDILAEQPGQNAWVLQSIAEAEAVTETTGDVSADAPVDPAVTS